MSVRKTKMCVSIDEKPLSEIICITHDVFGVVREVIDKIGKHLDYLSQHFKDIGLYKYPKIEEYEERESLYQHSKCIGNRILRNTPKLYYDYYEIRFENVKYEDLDDEELVIEIIKIPFDEPEDFIKRFGPGFDVDGNPIDFICTRAAAQFNLSPERTF